MVEDMPPSLAKLENGEGRDVKIFKLTHYLAMQSARGFRG
jgi:hypothetical protein